MNGVSNLGRLGVVRQCQQQFTLRVQLAAAVFWAQTQMNGRPQIIQTGRFTPFNLPNVFLTLLHFGPFAQHPLAALLKAQLHFFERDPFGRPHFQTIRPHHKANRTAANTLEQIGHLHAFQNGFAIGARMNQWAMFAGHL